jgi:hypothetical protein
MKKSVILMFSSLLLIAELILIIIFKNLPYLFSTFIFYFIPFLFLIIVFSPKIILHKTNLTILAFAVYYLILFYTGIYKQEEEVYNIRWLFRIELLPIFISSSLFIYFSAPPKLTNLINIVRFTILFILITSITSIIGLIRYLSAARDLAGSLGIQGEFDQISFYKKIGIAGYDFFYGIAYVMPALIMIIKKHRNNNIRLLLLLVLITVFLLAIVYSQMTTALISAIIGITFSIIGAKKIRRSFTYFIITIVVFFYIPPQFYSNSLQLLSSYVPGETLQSRLLDISKAIQFADKDIINDETHIGSRAQRIPFLMSNIYKSPIIGGGQTTGHNFWLDRLSKFGFVGIIPWIFLYFSIIKTSTHKMNKEYIYYYSLSLILFISVGFIKGSGGYITYILQLFLMPSLLIIYSNGKSLFKRKSNLLLSDVNFSFKSIERSGFMNLKKNN